MGESSTAPQEAPPLEEPAPATEPALEPEPSFQPTKSLFVERHFLLNKAIRVYDITGLAATTPDGRHDGAAYRAHACAVGQSAVASGAPAAWTLSRPRLRRRFFRVLAGDHGGREPAELESVPALASWREPVSDWRDVAIEFAAPADGRPAHCDHPVTVHTKSRVRHWERFVVESAEFVWRCRPFREPRYVLEKWSSGGRRDVVAQFWCPKWWVKHSGALAVDTREVDHVVALLTWYVALRKIQRRK
jgi:hypothetical protein